LFYRKAVSSLSSVEEREEGIVDEQVKRKTIGRREGIYLKGRNLTLKDSQAAPARPSD
jgi:hypothetical protein